MTMLIKRQVRCYECDRPTGDVYEQDLDAPPAQMPEVLCANCDYGKLPAPWRPTYYDEDEETPYHPAPECGCGCMRFDIVWTGVLFVRVSMDENGHWCEDCNLFHVHPDEWPEPITRRRTIDGLRMPVTNGSRTICHDCEREVYVEWDID